LGSGVYRVGDGPPVRLTAAEADLLEAFASRPAMSARELVRVSGWAAARRTLARLRRSYGGLFAGAVRMPGRKGAGGYRADVRPAPTAT
jgi:hypothetical protein